MEKPHTCVKCGNIRCSTALCDNTHGEKPHRCVKCGYKMYYSYI